MFKHYHLASKAPVSGFNLQFPLPGSAHLPVIQCSSCIYITHPSATHQHFFLEAFVYAVSSASNGIPLPIHPRAIQLPNSLRCPKTMSFRHYEYHRQDERASEGKLQKEFKASNIGSAQHLSGPGGSITSCVRNHQEVSVKI